MQTIMKYKQTCFIGFSFLLIGCIKYSNPRKFNEYVKSKPHKPPLIFTDLRGELEDRYPIEYGKALANESAQPKVEKKSKFEWTPELDEAYQLGIIFEAKFFVKFYKDGSVEHADLYSYNQEAFIQPARNYILRSKFKKIEEKTFAFILVQMTRSESASCDTHGSILSLYSFKNDFFFCPRCSPELLPPKDELNLFIFRTPQIPLTIYDYHIWFRPKLVEKAKDFDNE